MSGTIEFNGLSGSGADGPLVQRDMNQTDGGGRHRAPESHRVSIMHRTWVTATFCASLLLWACSADPTDDPTGSGDIRLPAARPIVTLESELIGSPTDIALDDSGRVWIADARGRRLLVVTADGSSPRFIGKEGRGPGEFRSPARVTASDTLVRVIDAENSRVQDYLPDGTHLDDHLVADPMIGGGALAHDGRIVVPTAGQHETLARMYNVAGEVVATLGSPVVPTTFWNFTAMKAEIADGRVPDQFRNTVTPLFGRGDAIWLLVQTESEVRKYGSDGALIWTRRLDVAEVEESRREFFRRNAAEDNPSAIIPLSTMATARQVNGDLWVLMRAEAESRLAVFYILDAESGEMRGRRTVAVPSAVNQFAIDAQRRRLYLTIPAEASVLVVELAGTDE